MARITITFSGLDEIRQALNPSRLNTEINRAVARATSIVGREFRKDIKANTPVDTGLLRRSVRVRRRRESAKEYELQVFFITPAAEGGKRLVYGYIVNARQGFVGATIGAHREKYYQILVREIGKVIREHFQQ